MRSEQIERKHSKTMRTPSKIFSLSVLMIYTGVAFGISAPPDIYATAFTNEKVKPASESQLFTASATIIPVALERDGFTVTSAAQTRQKDTNDSPGSVTSQLRQTRQSIKLHEPDDKTVFFPLKAWTFDYQINGYQTEQRPTHGGTDFQAPSGTEIYAVAAGVVTEVGSGGGFGNYLIIEHQLGGHVVTTLYAHQVEAPIVNVHDTVEALELIGHVGSTGDSTGPHLHLVVKIDGVAQDPAAWLELNALR